MKIPIPNIIASAWDAFTDWSNVPLYRDLRRIDIILVVMGLFVVTYYAITSGLQMALMGGVMYAVIVALALWVL